MIITKETKFNFPTLCKIIIDRHQCLADNDVHKDRNLT